MRDSIVSMRPYSPPLEGREEYLRLDFNENTLGCSPKVIESIKKFLASPHLASYPSYAEATSAVGDSVGVSPDSVLLVNGTDEGIQLILGCFVASGEEVVVLEPTYAMYRFYAEAIGAKVVGVELRSEPTSLSRVDRFTTTAYEISAAAVGSRTKVICIANPNNPTGSILEVSALEEIASANPGVCLLVDEAYYEFSGVSAIELTKWYENVVVSRTFSKAFGLAGLRIGYLIGNPNLIAQLRKARSPYSVNSIASAAVVSAIENKGWVEEYVELAGQGKALLVESLLRLGFQQWESHGNFVLFDSGGRADEIVTACKEQGILIRDRSADIPGSLRVTTGTQEQIASFVSVLEGLA